MRIIVLAAIIIFIIVKFTPKKQEKKITPPTEEARYMGCGIGDCGYWSPRLIKDKSGKVVDIKSDTAFCSYKNIWVKRGDKCPFAEEHPEQLLPGIFS